MVIDMKIIVCCQRTIALNDLSRENYGLMSNLKLGFLVESSRNVRSKWSVTFLMGTIRGQIFEAGQIWVKNVEKLVGRRMNLSSLFQFF